MKKTYLKLLLTAVGLLVGSGAWAQTTTTLLEYGTANNAWDADALAEWTAGGSPTIKTDYVEISGGNGSYETSKAISPTEDAVINVQAVWRGRSNTGRRWDQGNGSYFRFGNIIVGQNDQSQSHGYGFSGLANIASVTTFTAGSYRTDIENCTWLLIEMEISTSSNKVTSFSVKSEDGNTTYASASDVVLQDADYTTVAFGYKKSGSVSTANKEDLKWVKITQTVKPVTTANYTVKYVCGDTEVKESVSRKGEVDQAITLSSTDTENFYTESQKYIYVSSDVEGKKVAEGVVVTVKFREAEKYAWTAKSSAGSYTISGETWEGDKASVKYPLYQLVGKDLWTKGAINMTFAQDFDVTENNQELSLDYTETEITDVVFYSEGEDIEGASVINTGNAAARSSQRAAGYSASGNLLITSLPLGKFKVYARFYSPTSAGGKYNFFAGARNIWAVETGNSNATDLNTEVVLAQTDNPIALGQTGYTQGLDFIYIQYLGEPTAEELIAAALSEAKAQLSDIIAAATSLNEKYLNNSDMTDAITTAQYIVDDPTATLDNVEDAIASMQTIAETAFPEVMAKVKKFLAENPGITVEGIDELEAAVAAKDLVAIGAAADKAYTSFSNAAAAFVQSATDLAAAGEAASAEGVTDLQTAIAAATAVLTADGKTIEDKAKALVALNEALNAYKIANGSDLLKEAVALAADEDAVAVGKLKQAIAVALAGNETELQTAVDQFKADNAGQESDQTAKVATNGWKKFDGSAAGVCATQYAPAIDTYDGRKNVNLAECFEGNGNRTGTIIYQDITGLVNGSYRVGFYGNAFSTSGRDGFECTMVDGAEDVAYVFANDQQAFIAAHIATSTTVNEFRTFDVIVTNGTIKLGMGKAEGKDKSTNWHTMQIYQLTWFTTAKELFALDFAEMQAAIAEAEALNADVNKTEGKAELAAAIETAQGVVANKQMYNITEMQEKVTDLENAIAAFKAANYVAYEGVAYVQSVATGKYMAAGHDWGTRAIVNEIGLDLTFAANAETKKVTIDSQVSNGGDSHFLGSNLYMDSNAFEWIIEKFGENYSISNGEKYLGVDEKDNLALVDDAYAWAIVPDTDVKAARMATLEGATEIDPVDATWMMSNPNFNRNDQRVSAWAVSEDCTNKNLNGGNQVNNCAESFHSTFTISQAITGAPAGLYKLTAQGFYRQDQDNDKNDVTEAAPKFFIGTETAEVPARAGEESSMSAASESFANGQYTIAPIEFFYDGENTLTVGVEGTALYQWVIFDNFQLSYLGMPSAVVAEAIDDDYFTFSSKYPVDLDNLPEGLKAYYVDKVEGDEAYVEEATGAVAAGTGLLLKAETADEYEIPVVATSNKLDGNLLVGVQEKDAQKPAIQGEGYYVLIDAADGVEFSQVNGGVPVELSQLVGKAYLYYASAIAGKLRIVFPGEATAINSLDAEAQKSGKGIYNLSGQKVNAGYKGIVIVNGKKVMMK